MTTENRCNSSSPSPIELVPFDSRLKYAFANEKLCDAVVITKDGAKVPVVRFILAVSCGYFADKYLTNGGQPLRDREPVEISVTEEVFRHAIRYFRTEGKGKSPFTSCINNFDQSTERRIIQRYCRTLVELVHAAMFLQTDDLFKLCSDTLSKLVSKFRFVACTARETMHTDGHQSFDKDHVKLVFIQDCLLQTIANDPQGSLLVQVPGISDLHEQTVNDPQERSRNRRIGILELSTGPLRAVVKQISRDPCFAVKSIFFWAANGTPLCETTRGKFKNPSNDLQTSFTEAKQLIETLPLQDLNPEFRSSYICDTEMVDRDRTNRLSHSALKKTLRGLSKIKKKLSTTRQKASRSQARLATLEVQVQAGSENRNR